MTTELELMDFGTSLSASLDRAKAYAAAALSDATKSAYSSDWTHYVDWCEEAGLEPLPAMPHTIASYVAAMADDGFSPRTIDRRMTTIRRAHAMTGAEDPTAHESVRLTIRGVKRTVRRPVNAKKPLMARHVRSILKQLTRDDLLHLRDRVLVLIGYVCALRRSELVALKVGDVAIAKEGMTILVSSSKTDQEGRGVTLGIHRATRPELCPVRAVEVWLEELEAAEAESRTAEVERLRSLGLSKEAQEVERRPALDPESHLIRSVTIKRKLGDRISENSVNRIIKKLAGSIGLHPPSYGAHSLRSGHVSERRARNEDPLTIAEATRHHSLEMIRTYDRGAKVFRTDITEAVGL